MDIIDFIINMLIICAVFAVSDIVDTFVKYLKRKIIYKNYFNKKGA